ncbi:type II secretion system protein [Candidatus Dependentiae bacterium]|nr:MAG: type II secretion system protein [Candidatus Dependentiae bacterium]
MKRRINRGFTLIELLVCVAIVGILLTMVLGGIRGCSTYSEGSRVGVITKFSLKGVSFKTWEGELLMGGMRNTVTSEGGSQLTANVWEFTVDKDRKDPVDAIQNAMDHNRTVRVVYEEKGFSSPLDGNTRYRVKEVRVVEPEKK